MWNKTCQILHDGKGLHNILQSTYMFVYCYMHIYTAVTIWFLQFFISFFLYILRYSRMIVCLSGWQEVCQFGRLVCWFYCMLVFIFVSYQMSTISFMTAAAALSHCNRIMCHGTFGASNYLIGVFIQLHRYLDTFFYKRPKKCLSSVWLYLKCISSSRHFFL